MLTDDSHLEPDVPGPLCAPDSQHVVNHIQKASTLILTGTLPDGFVIKGDLKPPGPEDYGSGGLHDIFRGEYREKLVALKHPRAFGMVRPSDRKRLEDDFRRCSLIAFNMHHENVLEVLGIVDDPAFHGFSLVCPWMEIGDLRNHLDQQTRNGQLSGRKLVRTVNQWLLEIAKGLDYLHEHGVVHGDVRGVNVLLDGNRVAHLTPFGSSVIVSADEFSNPGLQSPIAWIAPELFDPKKFGFSHAIPSLATDVYAFGCTCIELYTSQSPYPRLRDSEILSKVIKGSRPQRPMKQGEAMPDSLWNFARRCWDQHIARRPSISEAVLVLADLADQ
ncbi:hypothetical protein NLI96_g5192 [Meripilus lineatus]|uniref:Protein kinase domain-containing protein n=1 Tax=Meripilus lineatus TaxID=2056292 RepID=A0AAD5V3F6_9APHY|nr:hypothetical protein NLI96_g5192 [Physisporinus lineatus]